VLWDANNDFDFRIFDDAVLLENAIREKAAQGFTARMTAGFCWQWSNPKQDGSLVADVGIGDYQRPWNAKPEATKLAKGIPKATLWAHDPNGLNQVGCVYTAQGFEFDYVGVIFGLDLVFDPWTGKWLGDPQNSADPIVRRSKGAFLDLVKNTYRVLLSRGIKGCYVYFMDENTRNFVISRMERPNEGRQGATI
jgi:hypothetical protein